MTIYSKLSGGLGNQIFQYAVGKSLALQHACPFILDTTWFENIPDGSSSYNNMLKYLKIKADFINSNNQPNELLSHHSKRFWQRWVKAGIQKEKRYFQYDNHLEKMKPPIYLDGYWQSYRYFSNIRNILLQEIQPLAPLSTHYEHYAKLIGAYKTPIMLHLRRGDYVTSKSASQIHGTLPLEYYQKNIEFFETQYQDINFFIFSDDIAWCKNHLRTNAVLTFITPAGLADDVIQELYLMTQCKHHVIANSTLSWWGAWLSPNTDQ